MGEPCIITVAITGSVPRKKDTAAVPVTVAEQIESTHEAYEAGARLVPVPVRDGHENPSSDPETSGALLAGARTHSPAMLPPSPTGGPRHPHPPRAPMSPPNPARDPPAPPPA